MYQRLVAIAPYLIAIFLFLVFAILLISNVSITSDTPQCPDIFSTIRVAMRIGTC